MLVYFSLSKCYSYINNYINLNHKYPTINAKVLWSLPLHLTQGGKTIPLLHISAVFFTSSMGYTWISFVLLA